MLLLSSSSSSSLWSSSSWSSSFVIIVIVVVLLVVVVVVVCLLRSCSVPAPTLLSARCSIVNVLVDCWFDLILSSFSHSYLRAAAKVQSHSKKYNCDQKSPTSGYGRLNWINFFTVLNTCNVVCQPGLFYEPSFGDLISTPAFGCRACA